MEREQGMDRQDKEYKEIFNDSYRRLLESGAYSHVFLDDFYRRFMASSPEVAGKFKNTNMDNQKQMLKASLYQMLMFLSEMRSNEYMENIAAKHNRRGLDIRPGLYDLWLECLISSVREHDPRFTPDVELAWRLTMAPGITYMKFCYEN